MTAGPREDFFKKVYYKLVTGGDEDAPDVDAPTSMFDDKDEPPTTKAASSYFSAPTVAEDLATAPKSVLIDVKEEVNGALPVIIGDKPAISGPDMDPLFFF